MTLPQRTEAGKPTRSLPSFPPLVDPKTYRLSPTQAAGLVETTWCTDGQHATREHHNATPAERASIRTNFAAFFTAASMEKMVALGLFANDRGCWFPTEEGIRVAHAIRVDWACKGDMPRTVKLTIPADYRPNE